VHFAPHVLGVIAGSHLLPVRSTTAFINSNFNFTISIPIYLKGVGLYASIELHNL
jgi:hypothetical protein